MKTLLRLPSPAWMATALCAFALTTGRADTLDNHRKTTSFTPPEGPRLDISAPREGAIFQAPATIEVRVAGWGRLGGITDTELLLDGQSVGESHLRFFRAPTPEEPVHHVFGLSGIGAGSHTLIVRELGDSRVASAPLQLQVTDGPGDPPEDLVPSLRILSPAPGATFELGDPINVEAVGVGRFGGITHIELLVDGVRAAESQIVFIRAPNADEPVYHQFELGSKWPVGAHRLVVREVENPDLASAVVPIHVLAPMAPDSSPLLRLTSLTDGTLLVVLSGDERPDRVEIQASADLLRWESVGPGWPALSVPVAKPATAGLSNASRFYRAVTITR